MKHVKSESSESDEHVNRKKTKKSKSAKVKRNMTIYPGKMYNHSEASEDVSTIYNIKCLYVICVLCVLRFISKCLFITGG